MFNWIYFITCGLYGRNLDNYLYDNRMYGIIGIIMIAIAVAGSLLYYYCIKPTRKQYLTFYITMIICALLNSVIAIIISHKPIRLNQIDSDNLWNFADCMGLGFANAIWTCIFFFVAALIFKWKSNCKYVPFKKF